MNKFLLFLKESPIHMIGAFMFGFSFPLSFMGQHWFPYRIYGVIIGATLVAIHVCLNLIYKPKVRVGRP